MIHWFILLSLFFTLLLRSSRQLRRWPSTRPVRSLRRTWRCSARPGSRSSATWPCYWERSMTSLKAGEVCICSVNDVCMHLGGLGWLVFWKELEAEANTGNMCVLWHCSLKGSKSLITPRWIILHLKTSVALREVKVEAKQAAWTSLLTN